MKKLLKDLAYLSGLRDRTSADLALVKLIAHSDLWHFTTVRLLRAMGPVQDQRWVTLGQIVGSQSEPDFDGFCVDASTLPRLAEFTQREAAIVTESVIRAGNAPCVTVFPIDTQASVCSLLEVESVEPLSPTAEAMIDSVLHLFENIQGLLDRSERDTVTGLLNREAFNNPFLRVAQSPDTPVERSQTDRRIAITRTHGWLAVADFAPKTNDDVLRNLADLMRDTFSWPDQLYRLGGNKFVLLLRSHNDASAMTAVERLRHQIEKHAFPHIGRLDFHMGLVPLRDNDNASDALTRADLTLDYAKKHNKNEIYSYTALVASGKLVDPSDKTDEFDFY
jgi:diguanylate cyclase (GGDEF)-like protein